MFPKTPMSMFIMISSFLMNLCVAFTAWKISCSVTSVGSYSATIPIRGMVCCMTTALLSYMFIIFGSAQRIFCTAILVSISLTFCAAVCRVVH